MVKSALFQLATAACCLMSVTALRAELVASPNDAYAIRIEHNEPRDKAAFPFHGARMVEPRTGNVIQTLRPDDDLDYDEISVLWSPDSTW